MDIAPVSGASELVSPPPTGDKKSADSPVSARVAPTDDVEPIREESIVVLVRSISHLLSVEMKEAGKVPPVHVWLMNSEEGA